ncbi:MAG TPA: 6-carboxytetrahydropterin synthase QueD [Candidatus Syntrophoarchaeum butanivorans]|uniref:6-carboxytetrahydropterin synthase QueD n=1 Tax=Candidatus Syntropharchaeum butanivorans TaxID=1839936 RepID=A0A7C1B3N0_9EURY|nr:6-carboxytetrahydropterin synthase QueD [Candidatus Syntrophoarchaeum butanivorans]
MKVGVSLVFDAAHSLPEYEGKCRNIHGHTYRVDIVVEGDIAPDTRFVIDFADLKALLREVVEELDHRYINEIIDYPTAEYIALYIRDEMVKRLDKRLRIVSLRLYEGEDKWVEVEG